MNHSNRKHHARGNHAGITLLEILIVLGLLAVLLSFASTSLTSASARAELKVAVETMDLSIRMARNTARQLDTPVVLRLEGESGSAQHVVTYSTPELPTRANTLLDYQFPASVRVVASGPEIRFDARGLTEQPVSLTLVSAQVKDLSQRILVE